MFGMINKKRAEFASFLQNVQIDSRVINAIKILLASCVIGVSAQIKIPLYFTPVPLVIAPMVAMLIGIFLGSRNGFLAVLCYLLQGAIGLPVWAGGASGFAYLMGPTGGYLAGYLVHAFLIGKFLEKFPRPGFLQLSAVLACSVCMQMTLGSLWLARIVGFSQCFALGFYPFIVPELVKMMVIATSIRAFIGFRKGE